MSAAAHVAENHGVRLDLILTMRDIYINSILDPLTNLGSTRKLPADKSHLTIKEGIACKS